jgi:hypothetical protein
MDAHTMEIGRTIKCTVEEYLRGLMVESTKVNTSKTKSKGMALFTGQMVGNTLDNGLMESNTVQALLLLLMANNVMENGITEKELDG